MLLNINDTRMKEEKGKWEDIIRSKIYDFEAETNPDDWNIISEKLSEGGKVVKIDFFRKYRYAAAAVAAAIIVAGGLFFYPQYENKTDVMAVVDKTVENIVESSEDSVDKTSEVVEKADNIVEKSGESVDKTIEKTVDKSLVAIVKSEQGSRNIAIVKEEDTPLKAEKLFSGETERYTIDIPRTDISDIEKEMLFGLNELRPETVTLDKTYVAEASSGSKQRRWGFGMGGGSYTAGTSSGSTGISPYSNALDIDEYLFNKEIVRPRSASEGQIKYEATEKGTKDKSLERAMGKITHKRPISAGLGVSYHLNDHLSLQSGAVYTLLRSKGSYSEIENVVDWKQNLHFVGVPLSLSYKIAEWNRFQFYASAGAMGEFNVSGKIKNTIFVNNTEIKDIENIRMKAPLWSVNTRGGVVYPIWKFISAYAEAGASYYFENNSKIETIRSDKPFDVSLQAGLRLGF